MVARFTDGGRLAVGGGLEGPPRTAASFRPDALYPPTVFYPYEDLYDAQFEQLVVQCMRKLFGIGVQSFATGKDGGRDALFVGTAERYPSKAAPWAGTTIGQAKHTIATNVHFSDAEFSADTETSVLGKEATRVAKLVAHRQVDNYIVFANRRLGGVTEPKVREWFCARTGLAEDQMAMAGVEYLDDLLRAFPEILSLAKVDPLQGPLLVTSYDIAEVILAVADQLKVTPGPVDAPVTDRVSYDAKNIANKMSPEFAEVLSKRYLRYTARIDDFLADPANADTRRAYDAAVEDFQLKIIEKRSTFSSFDAVFNHLVDLFVKRDGVLARHRRLLRAMLFYMYWRCDIGETPHAAAE